MLKLKKDKLLNLEGPNSQRNLSLDKKKTLELRKRLLDRFSPLSKNFVLKEGKNLKNDLGGVLC